MLSSNKYKNSRNYILEIKLRLFFYIKNHSYLLYCYISSLSAPTKKNEVATGWSCDCRSAAPSSCHSLKSLKSTSRITPPLRPASHLRTSHSAPLRFLLPAAVPPSSAPVPTPTPRISRRPPRNLSSSAFHPGVMLSTSSAGLPNSRASATPATPSTQWHPSCPHTSANTLTALPETRSPRAAP